MKMWRAKRLEELPPYLFVEIDRRKQAAQEAGRDLIDFGIGDPDQPTPDFIVQRMAQAVGNPATHRYASTPGTFEFRQAAARFIGKRFGVDLDPKGEVLSLLGSKEGIGHLPTALVNPGETVLVPDPGYPVYASGVTLAGGTCHTMALHEDRGWLPALDEIPPEVARNAKL
ncbi:MAG: aminotransferase class I/II-fold pyridoxal phosphate-dependent enzyme, partial [Planctomycetes bacterium]|nr:aminotransferase class I/II-fold pyridoxal phosphate-dependent enzyme [Planctomycetota bacterium]